MTHIRRILRQLSITKEGDDVILDYKCKICDVYVTVVLTKQEWLDLEAGIPFKYAFPNEKLQHLAKGLCLRHWKKQ